MILDCFFYIFFFIFALSLLSFFYPHNYTVNKNTANITFPIYIFALLSICLMAGIRYGIGTDYFSYKTIHSLLGKTSFHDYFIHHFIENDFNYSFEIGYYFLNRIFFFDYHVMLIFIEILILFFVYKGIKILNTSQEYILATFIYLTSQFLYSMNGIRFAIAISIIFAGFKHIINKKPFYFSIYILLACCFHKTALVCLCFYFLKPIKNRKISKLRDIFLFIFIISFFFFMGPMMEILKNIPFFNKYFIAYVFRNQNTFSIMILFHIIPVILPILLLGKNCFKNEEFNVLFRIYLLELPFRIAGLINTWITRMVRYPQMVEILLIPIFLTNIKNKRIKSITIVYYVGWYIFEFIYYAIINDALGSLPYATFIHEF